MGGCHNCGTLTVNLPDLDLGQEGWLRYRALAHPQVIPGSLEFDNSWPPSHPVISSLAHEWERARKALFPGEGGAGGVFKIVYDVALSPEASQIRCEGVHDVEIRAGGPAGALYGLFRFLRALQMREAKPGWQICHQPAIPLRAWLCFDNVWPRVDIERGYGGESLFPWRDLPQDPAGRLEDFARLLASAGLNVLVPNNVNAGEPMVGGWRLITDTWISKVQSLAQIFRRWGIRIGLSIAYNAPELSGELPTSDPREEKVQRWWQQRAEALYAAIPDFAGWVIKADCEGQAGPMAYGVNHAEGCRHLASALSPFGGRLFWRCFVYGHEILDITAQPYRQFQPLDGFFPENVTLLIKNGPRDFQVREPLHPLFGAMHKTACALELQVTQEYLGHDTHVVFLPSQWEEILGLPTQDGRSMREWLPAQKNAAIFGIANTNDSPCWTGHLFAQANWLGFGRLAWNPQARAADLAREWATLAFDGQQEVVETASQILLESYHTFEGYTAPFCLGQIYNTAKTWDSDHYDPDPWRNNGTDWFHADAEGVGFPRAQSEHFSQYPAAFRARVAEPGRCEENYLLWFHRLPWDWQMRDGRSLLENIRHRYQTCSSRVDQWIESWSKLFGKLDCLRFAHVLERLLRQRLHGRLWARYMITYLEWQASKKRSN